MLRNRQSTSEDICDPFCSCNVCNHNNTNKKLTIEQNSTERTAPKYCMHNFLELLPKNLNIYILSTASYKQKLFYFNKYSNHLMTIPLSKITQHFPLAINVTLFYANKSIIVHKYEIAKAESNYNYVQIYSPTLPFTVQYHRQENFMDQVLTQKLESLVKSILKDQNYQFSPAQKDFLIWVHKDYKDTIFCKYMAKIYCRFIQLTKYQSIVSAQFQWVIEKIGFIRLYNVKYMKTEKIQKIATFQQEYEQKILEKLSTYNDTNELHVNLFNTSVMKSKINNRIQKFKHQIRDIFQKQKVKILEKTQKQRTIQSKSASDDVARLFLPQLHNYSSLREVLNDEKKFKKVVLGIDQDAKPAAKGFSTIKAVKKIDTPLLSPSKNKNIIRRHPHHRSKTQA